MQNLPEIVVGIVVAMFGWFLKDKMAGVKEIDEKLSEKIDRLMVKIDKAMELVYDLKSAVKGIDDLGSRLSRAEHRLDALEALNREKR